MAKKAERKKSALPFDKRIAIFLLVTVPTVLISFSLGSGPISPGNISTSVFESTGFCFLADYAEI